jgi:hypothetical protein
MLPTRLKKRGAQRGSALLNVLLLAAILAILLPSAMEYLKKYGKSVESNRGVLVRNLSFASVGAYSYSPAALYASYKYSTWPGGFGATASTPLPSGSSWSAGTVINPCFRLCMGGKAAGDSNSDVTGSCTTTSGSGGTACKSRESDNSPAWYLFSLFHPTINFQLIAGPDARTGTAATPSTQTSARYTIDGYPCPYTGTNADNQCPFVATAKMHPVCPGDVWLSAAPSGFAEIKPNDPIPKPTGNIFEWIREAKAGGPYSTCCIPMTDLSNGCGSTPPSPYVLCQNDPCTAYNPNVAGCSCCGGTLAPTSTSTSTSTSCDLLGVNNSCITSCAANSGLSALQCSGGVMTCKCADGTTVSKAAYNSCCSGIGTATSTGTDSTVGTGTYTGSFVRTCTMASSIMVWYTIEWTTVGTWATSKQLAGTKTLDSTYNALGTSKMVPDIPQTAVCGKIFNSTFNNAAAACP